MTDEMMTTTAVSAPRLAALHEDYRLLVEAARRILRDGVDYATIPGTLKPVLLKPGAEKLARAFGLSVHVEIDDSVLDWERPFFYYRMQATVYDASGREVVSAFGSANSMEPKWRWRKIPEWEATPEIREKATHSRKVRGRNGRVYTVYYIENPDIFGLENTIMKMAWKRAYVAAVQAATMASEFFTQDLEDLAEVLEAEIMEETPPTPPQTQTGTEKPRKKNGRKWPPRPWDENTLREALAVKARAREEAPVNAGLLGATVAILNRWLTEDGRHRVLEKLFGVKSVAELSQGQKVALIEYVSPEKGEDGKWEGSEMARRELTALLGDENGGGELLEP